jgi:hypothetical protein
VCLTLGVALGDALARALGCWGSRPRARGRRRLRRKLRRLRDAEWSAAGRRSA